MWVHPFVQTFLCCLLLYDKFVFKMDKHILFPVPEDPNEEMDEDTQALLTADFEIGHYIRERIIPRAVLFYTGEALDDEDFEEEEGEEGENILIGY